MFNEYLSAIATTVIYNISEQHRSVSYYHKQVFSAWRQAIRWTYCIIEITERPIWLQERTYWFSTIQVWMVSIGYRSKWPSISGLRIFVYVNKASSVAQKKILGWILKKENTMTEPHNQLIREVEGWKKYVTLLPESRRSLNNFEHSGRDLHYSQ